MYLFGGSAGWLSNELLVLRGGNCTQFTTFASCLGDAIRVAARRCVWLTARGCLAEDDASLSTAELEATLQNASYVSQMCAVSASSSLSGSMLVLSNWSSTTNNLPLTTVAGRWSASSSARSTSSSTCSDARSCASCASITSADCWWCDSLQLCVQNDAWANALDLLAACPTHSWSRDRSVCSSASTRNRMIKSRKYSYNKHYSYN